MTIASPTTRAFVARLLAALIGCLVLLGPVAGLAQQPDVPASTQPKASLIADQRSIIAGLAAQVSGLQKQIDASPEDDQKHVDILSKLDDISRQLIAASVAFRPRLNEINARLDQLGPAPGADKPPESGVVTAERQALQSEKAEINAVVGSAEDLSVRVSTMSTRVAQMRRDLFAKLLTRRYDLNASLAGEVATGARDEAGMLYRAVSAWLRFVFNYKLDSVLGATLMALLAAAVILIGGRRAFGRFIDIRATTSTPGYLNRLLVAFWSTLLPSVALGVFLGLTYYFYDTFNVLRGDIGKMIAALFAVIGLVFFIHRLGAAVMAPGAPQWRLIPVRSRAASILLFIMSAMAAISGVDYFLSTTFRQFDTPLALTVAEALVATVMIGALVVAAGRVRPFADEGGRPRPWPAPVRFFFYVFGLGTIAAALLGYVGLARFLTQQFVWTGAVVITMYLGFLSARAISEEGAFSNTLIGQGLRRRIQAEDATYDQIGLIVSVAINILVVLIGLPLILFQWGFQAGDIVGWGYRIATGVQIGNFTLSLTGILWGLLVFAIGYVVTRWFQGWLDGSVMARGRVDAGVRNSIRTVVGYAGLAVAALIALSAAGIEFSNLALIAGGLSLGIGFGLQNIVQNFVSGLILLAERPFKAGDWIVAGAVSGTVTKISVRATEIETFQRQTVIMPNSELINAAVGNWTHRNKMGRVEIKVGVAYGSDVRRAFKILEEIARSHPLALKNPEPNVQFLNFGPNALEFEIRLFLSDILNGGTLQNDIRFAVLDRFAAEGIEIPSAPRWEDHAPKPGWSHDEEKAQAELQQAIENRPPEPRRRRRRSRRIDPI